MGIKLIFGKLGHEWPLFKNAGHTHTHFFSSLVRASVVHVGMRERDVCKRQGVLAGGYFTCMCLQEQSFKFYQSTSHFG